jgi:branched-chain amino acid transport system ATP-binding protein
MKSSAGRLCDSSKHGAAKDNACVEAGYALELRDVRKSFGKTEIIRGANLAVRSGERVAVIGPNGAGKSTLFNLISGRFGTHQRRHPAARPAHLAWPETRTRSTAWGLARSFQVSNLFTQAERV